MDTYTNVMCISLFFRPNAVVAAFGSHSLICGGADVEILLEFCRTFFWRQIFYLLVILNVLKCNLLMNEQTLDV